MRRVDFVHENGLRNHRQQVSIPKQLPALRNWSPTVQVLNKQLNYCDQEAKTVVKKYSNE